MDKEKIISNWEKEHYLLADRYKEIMMKQLSAKGIEVKLADMSMMSKMSDKGIVCFQKES